MNLIHKEFLIALANGEEVEYKLQSSAGAWHLVEQVHTVSSFDHPNLEFRIKPKTVTLSMEIPMPFLPKVSEEYWYLIPGFIAGVESNINTDTSIDKRLIAQGAYRTKQEAMQALEAQKAAIAKLLECTK